MRVVDAAAAYPQKRTEGTQPDGGNTGYGQQRDGNVHGFQTYAAASAVESEQCPGSGSNPHRPPAVLIALPIMGGAVWGTRAAYDAIVKRARLHLEAVLEHLERGESLLSAATADLRFSAP